MSPRALNAPLVLVAVLTIVACGTPHVTVTPQPAPATIEGRKAAVTVNGTAGSVVAPRRAATNVEQAADAAILASNVKKMRAVQLWNDTIAWNRAKSEAAAPKNLGRVSGGAVVSGSLGSVMACIRAHESGDPNEHSHISDGSGSYQAIPSTWREWSAKAGYPGYAYEYLAPPAVQDAVIAFMLTNGGAGNYSMRFGNDPCTRGLPGGG